jgi:hypothetical protein
MGVDKKKTVDCCYGRIRPIQMNKKSEILALQWLIIRHIYRVTVAYDAGQRFNSCIARRCFNPCVVYVIDTPATLIRLVGCWVYGVNNHESLFANTDRRYDNEYYLSLHWDEVNVAIQYVVKTLKKYRIIRFMNKFEDEEEIKCSTPLSYDKEAEVFVIDTIALRVIKCFLKP